MIGFINYIGILLVFAYSMIGMEGVDSFIAGKREPIMNWYWNINVAVL